MPSLDYEPDVLSPHVEHKVKLFNHEPKRTGGVKILVIDDDRDLCLGLRLRLHRSYETYCANDAEDGLRMAFSKIPDLIILDIGLPDYDGYFLMQSLREIPGLADVAVIVLTARDRFTDEGPATTLARRYFFKSLSTMGT